ncbi:hypothetical protein [Xanthomonas euvesicatoria]|uniref:hypothetical protein n=1 Tax=Xanthomonas euvesicatoria TaxID=456327 RepID=UPI002453C820|nr:hypothetical protein [Xanthomonas euvesicatoria]MDH4908506.1 hypothetical protein [Xanthomonas euvesicatoria]
MSLPVLQAPSVIEQINARLSAWQNRPISFFMRVAGCLGWVGQELAQHSTGQTRQHERTTEGSSRDIGITTGRRVALHYGTEKSHRKRPHAIFLTALAY